MPWSWDFNATLQIVEAVYEGEVTADDMQESTSVFITMEKEKGINRFLCDATRMAMAASLVDLYDLPANQYLEQGADRLGRVAVLEPTSPLAKQAVEFYQTACVNRGWLVQVFTDREQAIEWLTSIASPDIPDTEDEGLPRRLRGEPRETHDDAESKL